VIPLTLLPDHDGSRLTRDRLELLSALISAPSFDPLLNDDHILIPRDHPTFGWGCGVDACLRSSANHHAFCRAHMDDWAKAKAAETSHAQFVADAEPYPLTQGQDPGACRICPARPAAGFATKLCHSHLKEWQDNSDTDLEDWVSAQTPRQGFGVCKCTVCPYLAAGSLGLCESHRERYRTQGSPGKAQIVRGRGRQHALPDPAKVVFDDAGSFRRWCAEAEPIHRVGVINMVGLSSLIKAEIRWGLYAHCRTRRPSV